jgi:tRNA nucleotidyltransferase (CCA-adding enzyme)
MNEIIEKIRPTLEEREKVNQLVTTCSDLLKKKIKEKGLQADVLLTGSIAKDTWISGDKNIDIFIVFSHDYSEKQLKEYGLALGKVADYEIAYAEHPYVRNFVDGYEVDVVPAYEFKEGIRSSVDRTPLHTEYVNTHVQDRDQVRLLKKFTKSINVYGSDLKVEGLSGYLCELLVINYGSFADVLKAAADWKPGTLIFIENPPTKKFFEPLIFIDPVDIERNVAAVLSLENFTRFVYHSREYLKTPDPAYFFRAPERYSRIQGTQLYRIDFTVDIIDDILFPQLRKTRDFLVKTLETQGFSVMNSAVYDSGILLELSVFELPPLKRHTGPPIAERDHCENFLRKHTVAGFYRDRIYTFIQRKHTTAHSLLQALLESRQGFGKDLVKAEAVFNEVSDADVLIY